MMKIKIIICLCIISIFLTLTSCSPVSIEGIDQYQPEISTVGLTSYLFPDDDFLKRYEYSDGAFFYYDEFLVVEKTIAVLTYESDIYIQAKENCISREFISKNNVKEYKGFVFSENLRLPQAYNNLKYEYGTEEIDLSLNNAYNKEFPNRFNMIGYNDDLNTLIFIGFYCTDDRNEKVNLANTDFGAFLEAFFSEYYNFAQ